MQLTCDGSFCTSRILGAVGPLQSVLCTSPTGSAMMGWPVLSLSSGPRGPPGPSAAASVGVASTPGSARVRTETAAPDVHWYEPPTRAFTPTEKWME